MNDSSVPSNPNRLLEEILNFVDHASGLSSTIHTDGLVSVKQSIDGKLFRFQSLDIEEVLPRSDADGKNFIQINFSNGHKVLFTDSLVGFKPREVVGLDMTKLPKVVTTPDLLSVFEAIEDSMSSDQNQSDQEVEVLKKVFQSILFGGEQAGFDLAFERRWLSRLIPTKFRVSA